MKKKLISLLMAIVMVISVAHCNPVSTYASAGYTVEFTYNDLQYVLEGDSRVELADILDTIGIKENGEITAVEGSNDELFKPVFDEEEKAWYIEALKPFSTEEWLKVKIGEAEYEIVVTDAQTTGEWSKLQAVLNGTSETSVEGQFDVSSGAGVTTIKLLADFTANSATTLTVNGNKKLDLNGHVINANGNIISVITVSSGATLTLCDSTPDAEHYYKYNYNGAWVWDDSATSGAITVDEITDSTAVNAPILLKGGAITGGKGNVSNSLTYGGGIFNCGNLKIDGGNIVGNGGASTNYGGGIYSIVSFELNVGNIVGNYAQIHGGGVYISQTTGIESHFVMNDGQIIYNAAVDQAGGVYLNSGSFDLYGGSISHNHAQNLGGGVTCLNGTLKMYEGEISYNKTFGTGSSYGFGGGVHNMETMYLYGGRINNNSANYGGGIFNGYDGNPGTLTLTGGIVTENNANSYIGGVYHSSGSISLGGTTQITGNTKSADCQNFYLYPGTRFSITGDDAPKTEMLIGVTPNAEGMTAISNANDTDYSQHFSSDNDAFSIYYKSDNKLYLAHSSTVTIDLNGGSYPTGSTALEGWTYDPTSKTYSKKGSKVTLPDAPTAPAFTKFKGWKYNSTLVEAGTEIVFENTETRTYTAEYETIGSSIKTFATPGELTDPDCFALYTGRGSGIAQKVNFGEKTWYIAGKDEDGSLVLMSAPGNYANIIFGGNSTYSTSTVRDFLINTALPQFTTAERNMMQNTACSYVPAGGDKLYLANGIYDFSHTWITVGANNGIAIGMGNLNAPTGSPYTSSSGWFWLRVPYDGSHALMGYSGLHPEVGGAVHYWGVQENELAVIPAMNLNLSSVLFASSAPVASASTAFDDGMNFRIAAGEKIGSSAAYTGSKVSVTKGEDAGDLYLYVQGKDSSNDWVWSTKVTENSSFDVSSIHDGADLTECAIWLETLNGSDRLAYAKEAGVTSPYTVTLDANGGSGGDESVEVTLYSDMPSITVPTKDNAVFMGYFDAAEGGVKYYNADGTSAKAWEKSSDATLYAHWHTHSWTYIVGTGNDNHHKLYAVCSGPECEYYGTADDVTNAIALIVSVPSRTLTYDGNDFEATVTDTDNKWVTIFGSVPSNSYEYKEHAGDSYIIAPNQKDAGYYKASITVDGKTAYVEYLIAKASITPSVSIDGWTYGATPNTPTVTGNTGTGTVTYKYKKTSEADTAYTTTVPTACGEYTIKAEITETKNYNAGSATNTFAISKASRSSIEVNMSDYEYGQDTAPTPSIDPAASGLIENPSVTYKYKQLGSADEYAPWTGDTTALAVNTYEMIAVIDATDSYEEYTTEPTNFTVYKGEWKVTAPTAKTGLIYNCAEQELVNAGSVEDGGTLLYSLEADGTFAASIPKAANAGEYTVYYKVAEDGNHNEYVSETPITVTIAKADWNVTAPTAIAPSYTGSAQALINAGVVKDANDSPVANTMLYSLTGDEGSYSTDIPTATEVGSYTVYYKVAGDSNHNEYTAKTMTATIEKTSRTDMPAVSMEGYTYGRTGSIPAPSLSATPSENPTVTYYFNTAAAVDGAYEWKNITSTTLDAGTYYMFACISETESYGQCYTEFKQFDIAKADCTDITLPTALTLRYNGQPQALVSAGSSTQGTMVYSLTGNAGDFSAEIPKETAIGTYTVYYKVAGDVNHNDSTPDSLTVTIGKGIHNVTAPVALNPIENGNVQVLISAGNCTTGTLLYSLDGTEYFNSIENITASAIGTYTVYYKVEGNENYDDFGPEELTAKIRKKSSPIYIPIETPVSATEDTQDGKKAEEGNTEEYTSPVKEYNEQTENREAFIPVKAEISNGIAAVEEIAEDTLKDILDEMLNEAVKTGENADEATALTIDFSQATQAVTGVDLTSKTLEAISDIVSDKSNPIESVKLELSEAIVELDAKTLEAVLEGAEGDTVRVVVENTKAEGLNKSQSATLKGYDVDRTFEAYFESAGKRIHDFNGGKALVSLSFKPEKGKRVENYKVFYIDEEGKLQKMTTKYENGLITFVTGHFSDYAVVYENIQDVLLAQAKTTGKGYIKLSWNKIEGAEKYVVYGAKCGKAYKELAELDAETDGNSFIIKKISGAKPVSGKTYKLYVVAYDALGNKIKSKSIHYIVGDTSAKYANVKTITALQKTLELTVGEKVTVDAEYAMYEDKKHISKKYGKALRFTSDCPDVAKVAKDGTVTAKSEGKAVIYIQDIGGKWCQVEVTVKEK